MAKSKKKKKLAKSWQKKIISQKKKLANEKKKKTGKKIGSQKLAKKKSWQNRKKKKTGKKLASDFSQLPHFRSDTTLFSQKLTKIKFETTLVSQKNTFFENTN